MAAEKPSPIRNLIAVIDFGGQYAHLLVNRVRRLGAYSEIFSTNTTAEALQKANTVGVILSGGGGSVEGDDKVRDAIALVKQVISLNIPVLGVCFGMQSLAVAFGGQVSDTVCKEYGATQIELLNMSQKKESNIFFSWWKKTLSAAEEKEPKIKPDTAELNVFMSHGDSVSQLPPDFVISARTQQCPIAAFEHTKKPIFGVQFHPEVTHTQGGMHLLQSFISLCETSPWSMSIYLQSLADKVKKHVGTRKVFMLVSGGVDSTVCFALLNKVLGPENVHGLLVDTGLMRYEETKLVARALHQIGFDNLRVEDASALFLEQLHGLFDPEEKRKCIGNLFLKVKENVSEKQKFTESEWLLGMGTIYPDTIESGGTQHASTIKTHHNRVDAITKMIAQGRVVEPIRELYKDEVRVLGKLLGLPLDLVNRQPFPGPGLGIRILCAKNPYISGKEEKVLSQVTEILPQDLKQMQAMIPPVQSVGVQGDDRTYRQPLCLYANDEIQKVLIEGSLYLSLQGAVPLLINAIPSINRVILCVSHKKPPEKFTFTAGYITAKRVEMLRTADHVIHKLMVQHDNLSKIWQFPVVCAPFGLNGGECCILRPVSSKEAMTASAYPLTFKFIEQAVHEILQIPGLDMVCLDLTSKPPGTIEWE